MFIFIERSLLVLIYSFFKQYLINLLVQIKRLRCGYDMPRTRWCNVVLGLLLEVGGKERQRFKQICDHVQEGSYGCTVTFLIKWYNWLGKI